MTRWNEVAETAGLYKISEHGEVIRTFPYHKSNKLDRPLKTFMRNGYKCVNLSVNGKRTGRRVHRLLAEAFIPNPEKLPVVRHLNDNRLDNRLENLAWGTVQDNINDSIRNGWVSPGYPVRPHCKNGHEFTSENTLIRKDSGRACRECCKQRSKKYRDKKRGAL